MRDLSMGPESHIVLCGCPEPLADEADAVAGTLSEEMPTPVPANPAEVDENSKLLLSVASDATVKWPTRLFVRIYDQLSVAASRLHCRRVRRV